MANEEAAFNSAFGKRVKARREDRKLSQEALGVLLGLSRTSITNIEAGRQSVVAYTVQLLARHLDVSADELLQTKPTVLPGGPTQVFPEITSPRERAFLVRALSTEEEAHAE
jgi:transcriptional regulator with XRE-family HTH domain